VHVCAAGPFPHWLAKCYPALEELDLSNNRVRHAQQGWDQLYQYDMQPWITHMMTHQSAGCCGLPCD